ncbi:MAG: SH3 domain-containing protein [Peptococcaceae bacterium]|nr:SH3 domain-containing protein [Peptococcaceae bacterium]
MKRKGHVIGLLFLCIVVMCAGCGGNEEDNSSKQYEITKPASQEEAILSVEEKLGYWFDNACTEEDLEKLDEIFAMYEGYDVTDEVYEVYIDYLNKQDFGENILEADYNFQLSLYEKMEKSFAFPNDEDANFPIIKDYLKELVYFSNEYEELDIPAYCEEERFKDLGYIWHSSGAWIDAYALKELNESSYEDEVIDGYKLVLFTDYSYPSLSGGVTADNSYYAYSYQSEDPTPSHNQFYYVYLPKEENIYSGIWQIDNLYTLGTKEHDAGKFTYNAPVYFSPSSTDKFKLLEYEDVYSHFLHYATWLDSTIDFEVENIEYLKNPYETIKSADGYEWIAWESEILSSDLAKLDMWEEETIYARSGPGTEYDTVGALNSGDNIYVIDTHDGWCQIKTDRSVYGFVQEEYLVFE